MTTKIIIEIDEDSLERLKRHAEMEKLSVPEFISIAALRYVDQNDLVDEFELAQILEAEKLLE